MSDFTLLISSVTGSTLNNETQLIQNKFASHYNINKESEIENTQQSERVIRFTLKSNNTTDEDALRTELRQMFEKNEIDFILCSSKLFNTPKKLVCFDMDSCVLKNECIDEMAVEGGVSEQVSLITKKAMEQGLDFSVSLTQRLSLLKDLPVDKLKTTWNKLSLNPGAYSLMKALKQAGIKTALVSGGFTYFAYRVGTLLDMDYVFSNTLEIVNDKLTSHVFPPIVDGKIKESVLLKLSEKEGFAREEVAAIGDGANDRFMLQAAGFGTAYHGKAILREATKHHLNVGTLRTFGYFLNVNGIADVKEETLQFNNLFLDDDKLKQFLPLNTLLHKE